MTIKLILTDKEAKALEETLSDLFCHGSAHKAIYDKDLKGIRDKVRDGIMEQRVLNDKIDFWHDHYEGELALHEYLGMSWEEYSDWV